MDTVGASTVARSTLWNTCKVHSFEFLGGVNRLVVPDNPKTGVTRACRYDLI